MMTEFGSDLILARLQQLHPKSIDLSLARIERLLDRLGHPEARLPPIVHVAGTNGKGSTLAMLDAMLTAAGHKVHRYISPHLVRFNERIMLHGQPIDESLLADVLDECEQVNGGDPITFFEITTAAAFIAFGRMPADYLLLETGLGGRLDATNVIDRPALTLITPISMDHETYLGADIASIASEKAGIIKAGVPLITAPQDDVVHAVLARHAAERKAPMLALGRNVGFSTDGQNIQLEMNGEWQSYHRPAMRGSHQLENAGLAILAACQLGLDRASIVTGLHEARWAARLQRLTGGPLRGRLPPSFELWLDGGHNPAAGIAIASSLAEIAPDRPVDLVLGMLETKDTGAFLAPLHGHIDRLRFVRVPDEALSRDPAVEASRAREHGWSDAEASDTIEAALDSLCDRRSDAPRTILICGSLYLAGYILRQNY
ncbi:MAG: folylpolyglutamate synthase/dihydrofolate synthase family protein [Geminicoccaceae bacterium]